MCGGLLPFPPAAARMNGEGIIQVHPMPEFGSFTLLLALVLSAYTLVMGGVALWRSRGGRVDGGAARLGETARRGGRGRVGVRRGGAERVWICAQDSSPGGHAADGLRVYDSGRDTDLLFVAAELCRSAV